MERNGALFKEAQTFCLERHVNFGRMRERLTEKRAIGRMVGERTMTKEVTEEERRRVNHQSDVSLADVKSMVVSSFCSSLLVRFSNAPTPCRDNEGIASSASTKSKSR